MRGGSTRIYLVRHGETDWNALGLCQGGVDVPLNEAGVAQAEALRVKLRNVRFDAAYTSPLARARRTAEIVLAGRQPLPAPVPALSELSYGAWQGLAPHQWPGAETAGRERWAADPWGVSFPAGESLHDVWRRAVPVWDRMVAAHCGETVFVSGHGHVNRVLLLHTLGWARERFWELEQPNGAVWLVQIAAGVASAAPLAPAVPSRNAAQVAPSCRHSGSEVTRPGSDPR